jgi:hypothetical protein
MKHNMHKSYLIAGSIFCSIIASDTHELSGMFSAYNQVNDSLSYQLAQQQLMILLNKRELESSDYKINRLLDRMAYFDGLTKERFINICFTASLFGPLNFYTYHAIHKLIKLGADVNQMYTYYVANTKIKKTYPLILAAENRPASVVNLLLFHGADVMALDSDGNNALIMAVRKNKFEAADTLVQTVENNIHQQAQKHGAVSCSSALQQATDEWQDCPLEVMNYYIKPFLPADATQYTCDIASYINHQNNMGNTALIYAATNNHYPLVEYLLKHGSDARIKNKAGLTAYDYAARPDIRKMLQEQAESASSN